MDSPFARYGHPAWVTAGATLLGYGGILLTLFLLLFVVPLLVVTAL